MQLEVQVGRRHVLGRPLPGLSGAQILAHPQSISDPATTCRHLPYCGYRRQTFPVSSDREPLPVQYQNLRTIYTICIADTRAHCPFSDYTMLLWKPSVLLLLLLLLLSFFEIEIESLLSLHMQATTRCALLTPLDLTGVGTPCSRRASTYWAILTSLKAPSSRPGPPPTPLPPRRASCRQCCPLLHSQHCSGWPKRPTIRSRLLHFVSRSDRQTTGWA